MDRHNPDRDFREICGQLTQEVCLGSMRMDNQRAFSAEEKVQPEQNTEVRPRSDSSRQAQCDMICADLGKERGVCRFRRDTGQLKPCIPDPPQEQRDLPGQRIVNSGDLHHFWHVRYVPPLLRFASQAWNIRILHSSRCAFLTPAR
jgi:hypothetical protein